MRAHQGLGEGRYRVSVPGDENLLEIDCGDGLYSIRIESMPLNCTFKNG